MKKKIIRQVSLILTLLFVLNFLPLGIPAGIGQENIIDPETDLTEQLEPQEDYPAEDERIEIEPVQPPKPQISFGPYQAGAEPPSRAYEPFRELDQELTGEHAGGSAYHPNRINIKLKQPPPQAGNYAYSETQPVLAAEGVIDLEPLFPLTENEGAVAFYAMSEEEVELTKWYRAYLREGADPKAVIEALKDYPAVITAEPDYLSQIMGFMVPDALAGAVLAAKNNSGVLLVRGDREEPPQEVQDFYNNRSFKQVKIFGGSPAVSEEIETWFMNNLGD